MVMVGVRVGAKVKFIIRGWLGVGLVLGCGTAEGYGGTSNCVRQPLTRLRDEADLATGE